MPGQLLNGVKFAFVFMLWGFYFVGQGVDEPLSATGFRQADAAGSFLSNVKFTHVFSSDLLRAKQVRTS